jgi:hypothetical protein
MNHLSSPFFARPNFRYFLHGVVPIAVMQSSLNTIKPMHHLTHQDIVERFVIWFEQIRPILTVLCLGF